MTTTVSVCIQISLCLAGCFSAIASGASAPSPAEVRTVSFSYSPLEPAKSVSVVGTFNNWDRGANPLTFDQKSKTWNVSAQIPVGVYSYLFVVDGAKWVRDPSAPIIPDANQNQNSLLVVQPTSFDAKPGRLGDGEITTSALLHEPGSAQSLRYDAKTAWVDLRTRAGDVSKVDVVVESRSFPAEVVRSDPLYDYWRGRFKISSKRPTDYWFKVVDGPTEVAYGANGAVVGDSVTPFSRNFAQLPLPRPPEWTKSAVVYQIFPDRFYNGDESNDPSDVKPWGTLPTSANWQIRLGGDLVGIRKKITYLKSLGVDAVYLNPIFAALSNHGYDTVDYMKVDPRFGTNHELKVLVEELHKSGIKVILDGVFNHSSPDFFAFKDLVSNQQESAYKDWYFVSGFPVKVAEGQTRYKTFAGVPTMPKLNQDNPATREYFLKVARFWIQFAGIDGWRLDDADEVSQSFWRAFRTEVKAVGLATYILGEAWGNAAEYEQGDQFDGVMNYQWRDLVLKFFSDRTLTTSQFVKKLRQLRQSYPAASLGAQFDLLGSHDTPRIKTIFKGDFDRETQAIVFQFTYPGIPSIYYGDEIGMEGGHDPDDRRPMIWDESKWDKLRLAQYKKLISLRTTLPCLQGGAFTVLRRSNRTGALVYQRRLGISWVKVWLAGSSPLNGLLTGDCVFGPDDDLKAGDKFTLTPHQSLIESGLIGWDDHRGSIEAPNADH